MQVSMLVHLHARICSLVLVLLLVLLLVLEWGLICCIHLSSTEMCGSLDWMQQKQKRRNVQVLTSCLFSSGERGNMMMMMTMMMMKRGRQMMLPLHLFSSVCHSFQSGRTLLLAASHWGLPQRILLLLSLFLFLSLSLSPPPSLHHLPLVLLQSRHRHTLQNLRFRTRHRLRRRRRPVGVKDNKGERGNEVMEVRFAKFRMRVVVCGGEGACD